LRDNPTHGIAAAGGLRLNFGALHIAPEIRYTRWIGRPFDEQGSQGFFVQSARNQVDFLIGVRFCESQTPFARRLPGECSRS
jgi:hypothetical protein